MSGKYHRRNILGERTFRHLRQILFWGCEKSYPKLQKELHRVTPTQGSSKTVARETVVLSETRTSRPKMMLEPPPNLDIGSNEGFTGLISGDNCLHRQWSMAFLQIVRSSKCGLIKHAFMQWVYHGIESKGASS